MIQLVATLHAAYNHCIALVVIFFFNYKNPTLPQIHSLNYDSLTCFSDSTTTQVFTDITEVETVTTTSVSESCSCDKQQIMNCSGTHQLYSIHSVAVQYRKRPFVVFYLSC